MQAVRGRRAAETELPDLRTRSNVELVKAGVLSAGEGLQPSSKGARVQFSDAKRVVIGGLFAETKEHIAGFWLIQAGSRAEALEWAKRSANPYPGTETYIEVLQLFDAEDFGAEMTLEPKKPEPRAGTHSQR
jgi:hypothetical protein